MKAFALKLVVVLAGLLLWAPVSYADEKPVFVVHFTTGPNWQADKPPGEQTGFGEHSANLQRLRKEGSILFGARYAEFGMIFLASDSIEAAGKVLDADPGVVAGIFPYEVEAMNIFYPWRND